MGGPTGVQGNAVVATCGNAQPNRLDCFAAEPKTQSSRSTGGYEAIAQSSTGNQPVQGRTRDPSVAQGNRPKGQSYYAVQDTGSGRNRSYNGLAVMGESGKTSTRNVKNVVNRQGGDRTKNASLMANNSTGNTQVKKQTTVADAGTKNTEKKVAPAASELAKERSAMLNTVDKLVESALGKGKYAKPTDHRGYTALVSKAMKSMKSVADQTAFKNSIEAAGKPFGLNFGLSNKVNGKQVALNKGTVEKLDASHRAEYSKFAQEFSAPQQKKKVEPVKQQQQTLPTGNYPSSMIA